MGFLDNLLWPIKWVVAWIMVRAHDVLTFFGMDPAGGWTWLLSIVALVLVMRILLIPLFVRQIKASRGMQLLQPDMQKLQKKYKGKTDPASRQAMQQEMMALYRQHGTTPFASCLPILAQMPIFFALFRVLYSMPQVAAGTYARDPGDRIGILTQDLAIQFEASSIFGATLSSTFLQSDDIEVKFVTAVLIVIMSLTTLFTQRQLTMKNMPSTALENPMARQQRILMYVLPLIFAVTGVNFPIGVLVYWSTTNLWSMGQQYYVIRNNPTPGSEAYKAWEERKARKAARRGKPLEDVEAEPEPEQPRGQRQQPMSKARAKKQGAPKPEGVDGRAASAGAAGAADAASTKHDEESPAPDASSNGSTTPDRSGSANNGTANKPNKGRAPNKPHPGKKKRKKKKKSRG